MSFSYSADPSTSPTDEVRFLLGDVNAASPLLTDEEIGYYVAKLDGTYNDMLMVAAFCADVVAGKYAGEVSITADGVSYSGSELQQKFQNLAISLRARYKALQQVGAAPYAGGIDDFDVPPGGVRPLNFGIGRDDNPRAGGLAEAVDPGEYLW